VTVGRHRADEIQQAISWAQMKKCSVSFVTLTMRHHQGVPFTELRETVSSAWRWAINGNRWKRDREAARVLGYVRSFEATHGAHGWHVHVHVLLIHDGEQTAGTSGRLLAESMFDRWERGLNRKGYTAIRDSGGLDHRVVQTVDAPMGKYLAKIATGATAAFEVGSTATKVGRSAGSRSPWEILRDALVELEHDIKDGASQRLWREWTKGTKYWKTIHWSQGLRDLVGAQDLSDEEIVDQVEDHEVVAVISGDAYRELIRRRNRCDLLIVLELLDAGGSVDDLATALPWVQFHPPPPP
jgi:hypothetical protein